MSIQFQCPRCGKNSLITDVISQEVFCSKCGMVVDDRVNVSRPEISFPDSPVNKSHSGDKSSLLKYDRGLNTMINPFDTDSAGNPLSISMKSSLKRLRKWDSRSRIKNSDEKNLQYAFRELLKLKEKLSLPEPIIEKAAYIYRKALEKKLIRGRSIKAVIAASLYAACRESETPRTLREIASSVGSQIKEITGSYRLIFTELDMKMPVIDSVTCVSKIASNAELSEKTKRYAVSILKKAEKQNILAGKHPMGVAASAIYIAGMNLDENRTQKEIADAAGVTEVTVRNRCKTLKQLI